MNFPGVGGAAASPPGIDPNDPNMKKMAALMESCYAKTVMSGVMGFGLGGVFGMFMASMAYDTPYHTPTAANTPAPAAGAAATSTATGSATASAGKAAPIATQTAASTSIPHTTTASSTSTIPKPTATAASTTTTTIPVRPAASPLAAATQAGGAALAASPGSVPITSLPLKQQLSIGFRDMGSRSWSSAKNFGKVGALFSGIECGIEGLRAKNDIGNGVAAGCVTGAVLARNAGPQAAALGCAGFAAFSAAIETWMRSPGDE